MKMISGKVVLLIAPVMVLGGALKWAQAQVPKTLPFGLGIMGKLVFAQNGRFIVRGGTNWVGSIEFYDRKTGKASGYHPKATNAADAGSDSPVALGNTPFIAGIGDFRGTSSHSIGIYDLRAEKNFRIIARFQAAGNILVGTPDGCTLIAPHKDGGLAFWDVKTGALKRGWKNFGKGEFAPQALAVSSDGQKLATANYSMNYGASAKSGTDAGQNPQIWSLKTGKLLVSCEKVSWRKLPRTGGFGWSVIDFSSLDFSPDQRLLATGSNGNGIVVWDARSGKMKWAFGHPQNRPSNMIANLFSGGGTAFSPDSKRIAAPGNYGTIDVFSLSTGKLLRQIKGGGPLLWSRDGLFFRGPRTAKNQELLTQIKL